MPEEVSVRDDLNIIQIRSHGIVTAADFANTLESILGIREARGISRVLIDATAVESYPATLSIFDFGGQAADSLRGKGIKIAVVVAATKIEETGFFQTVARNRGGNIGVFESSDDALTWLKE